MKRRFEMVATVGEWTDSNGKKCKRTAQIGTVFESKNGRLSARLELVPVFPGWSGFVAFRDVLPPERRVSLGMPPAPAPEDAPATDDETDMPF